LDAVAKAQKIDIEKLWQSATKSFQNSANYQLMNAYKSVPVDAESRLKFSNGCEQMTRMISAGIDGYLAESSGGKKTGMDKDF
jgi:hypothetical protein